MRRASSRSSPQDMHASLHESPFLSNGSGPSPIMTTLSKEELQDRAVRGSLWTLLFVAVTMPLGIAGNAIVARLLGPKEYGYLALLTILFATAVTLAEIGFGQALTQWGVSSETTGDTETTRGLLRRRTGFVLSFQFPVLGLSGILLLHEQPLWLLTLFVAVLLCMLLTNGAQAVLLWSNRSAAIARISTVVGMLTHIGVIVVALMSARAMSVWITRTLLSLIGPLIAVCLICKHFRSALIRPRLPRRMPLGFWRFALLSWAAGVSATLVYTRSEVFILHLFRQETAVGIFALAFGLCQQLTLPLDSLLAPLLPATAGLMTAHPSHIREGCLRSLRFVAVFAGLLAALTPALFFLIPLAFGENYARSAMFFLPLGLASTLQSITSPLNVLVYARRDGGLLLRANVSALLVDIAAALVLVGMIGGWGAVVANLLGQATSAVLLTRAEARAQHLTLKQLMPAMRAWLLALASLVPSFLLGYCGFALWGALGAALVTAIVGPALYALLLRLSGGALTKADAQVLIKVFPSHSQSVLRLALRLVIKSW